jgi:hypothetical protein
MSNIKTTQDSLELKLINPIYKVKIIKDNVGNSVEKEQFVKELRVKRWFKKDAITSVENYITSRNTVSSKRCIVYDKYCGKHFIAEHTLDEIIEITSINSYKKIGF